MPVSRNSSPYFGEDLLCGEVDQALRMCFLSRPPSPLPPSRGEVEAPRGVGTRVHSDCGLPTSKTRSFQVLLPQSGAREVYHFCFELLCTSFIHIR